LLLLLLCMQQVEQIEHQFSSKDLFDAFKLQLAKDFEQSGFPADFIHYLPANFFEVQRALVEQLELSKKRADATTMALLNRIDISEAQLKQSVKERLQENQLLIVAELIIKRVLQKVVIKQYYKTNEGPEHP
jgi:hypothetical protein